MGSAILNGALAAKVLRPADVVVIERDEAKHTGLAATKAKVVADLADGLAMLSPDAHVLLAVKPQMFGDVAPVIASSARARHASVLSIMAGVTIAKLRLALPDARGIVRLMPNLPARIGQSMTALCVDPLRREHHGDLAFAERLFASVGWVTRIDESLMDAFTAVAGSGPAYLFYLAEAMVAAAVKLGFAEHEADAMVRQTLSGAAGLLHTQREHSAKELRAGVTSTGGTTAAATAVMDAAQFGEMMGRALSAARDRGRELAG